MKRTMIKVLGLAVGAMAISFVSYHAGFDDGYNVSLGGVPAKTVRVTKVICHSAEACGEAWQDGYDAGDHAARIERADVINEAYTFHRNDVYGWYISH